MTNHSLKSSALLLIIGINYSLAIGADIDLKNFDYSKADSTALSFPKKKYKSTAEIVGPLIQGLTTEHERARVIYRWITDNISYSYSNRTSDPQKVLYKKKAVCAGYAALLNQMMLEAGIRCVTISGNAKTETNDIGEKLTKPDHAWNAVYLQGQWYLLDVTWASGYFDNKKRKFLKHHNETYFLTPPDIFVKEHFPEDEKWQLLEKPMSKREFIRLPIYYTSWFECQFEEKNLKKGTLYFRMKDTLVFHFTTPCAVNCVSLRLSNQKDSYYPEIVNLNNNYWVKQKFDRRGVYYLTLFVNGTGVSAHRVKIRK